MNGSIMRKSEPMYIQNTGPQGSSINMFVFVKLYKSSDFHGGLWIILGNVTMMCWIYKVSEMLAVSMFMAK
jgi:hypothetical protein